MSLEAAATGALLALAGLKHEAAQDAKSAKLSRKGGAPIFSPSRLLAAVCRVAPQFKVSLLACYLDTVQQWSVARELSSMQHPTVEHGDWCVALFGACIRHGHALLDWDYQQHK